MKPTAIYDLSPGDFPLIIRGFRTDNDRLIWEERVESAPVFLRVPPLAQEQGVEVYIIVEMPGGRILDSRLTE